MKRAKSRPTLLPTLLAGVLGACSTGAGDGEVSGELRLPQCGLEDEHWDMGVDFFAASYFDNTLTLRLQRTGRVQSQSDGVLILLRDVEFVDANLGTPLTIELTPPLEEFIDAGPAAGTPTTAWDAPARATLYLNDSCPDDRYAFTDGTGTLTFDSVYVPDEARRIRGEFDLRFVDPRYWESPDDYGPEARLVGEFDFNYTRGSPAQTFP